MGNLDGNRDWGGVSHKDAGLLTTMSISRETCLQNSVNTRTGASKPQIMNDYARSNFIIRECYVKMFYIISNHFLELIHITDDGPCLMQGCPSVSCVPNPSLAPSVCLDGDQPRR